jgi:DNA-directed RNA polymerase subunit RPC12/RpoP
MEMSITEKAAYLKGLLEGMKLDDSKNEGKLLKAIIDLLGDMAQEIQDLNENAMDLAEEIDQISDDLADVEDFLEEEDDEDDEDEDDDECCCCGDCDEDEPVFYEVTCPKCGAEISLDEEILSYDSFKCPKCGQKLEFEFDEDDEDGEDEDGRDEDSDEE